MTNVVHAPRETEWKAVQSKGPRVVYIYVTDRCNFACRYCQRPPTGKGVDAPEELINRQIPLIREATLVDLTGYGEVLLSGHRERILDECKKWSVPFQLSTNGTPVTEKTLDSLIEHGVCLINLSIQSFKPERMKRICGDDCTERVEQAAKLLGDRKGAYQFKMTMVVNQENEDELADFHLFCVRMKADMAQVYRMESVTGWAQEQAIEWTDEIATLAEAIALSIRQHAGRGPGDELTDEQILGWKCQAPFEQFLVQRDGRVAPCCNLPEQIMGNLMQTRKEAIWNGQEWRAMRETILDGS